MSRWTMNHPPRAQRMDEGQLATRRANQHARYLLTIGPRSRADVLTRMAAKEAARRGAPVTARMNPDGSVSFTETAHE
jgi:hypothetical protein